MSTSAPEMQKQRQQQADQEITQTVQHLRQELDRLEQQSSGFDQITRGYGASTDPSRIVLEVQSIKERASEFSRTIHEKADRLLMDTYQQSSSPQSWSSPATSGVFQLVRQVLGLQERLWQQVNSQLQSLQGSSR